MEFFLIFIIWVRQTSVNTRSTVQIRFIRWFLHLKFDFKLENNIPPKNTNFFILEKSLTDSLFPISRCCFFNLNHIIIIIIYDIVRFIEIIFTTIRFPFLSFFLFCFRIQWTAASIWKFVIIKITIVLFQVFLFRYAIYASSSSGLLFPSRDKTWSYSSIWIKKLPSFLSTQQCAKKVSHYIILH